MKSKLFFIVISISLFFSPIENLAQAPNLGAASGYVLFTALGAFTNDGATNVTGDIGTNSGAFAGFPPGIVNGVIHVADSSSLHAATATEDAYLFMNGISCDSVIPVVLGNNQVLSQKVYCLTSGSTLNGNLTLDGQGDPNALFIFKIDGSFSTSTFSHVILIDSASANNVYWQINGAFVLGDSSSFTGTLIANGAISLLSGASLNGQALSRAGAINTYAINATLATPPVSTLPIELLNFNGYNIHSYNLLSWSTATETNNNYFTLERTIDGINFTEVSRITGSGTSSSTNYYSFADYGFDNAINYYRLKQTDYNGQSETFGFILINNRSSVNKTVNVINVLGQEVNSDYHGVIFIYYEDGTVEQKYVE